MMPYITYRDKNDKNELLYFILQRDFPHYQCAVSEQPIKVFVEPMPISDYNLFLVFAGVLRGMFVPSYNNVDKEISDLMFNMAEWFYSNRILIEPKKYKKWKIIQY